MMRAMSANWRHISKVLLLLSCLYLLRSALSSRYAAAWYRQHQALPQLQEASMPLSCDAEQLAQPTTEAIATTAAMDVFLPRAQFLQELLKCQDRPLLQDRKRHGDYWMVRNLVRGTLSASIGCAESITYTTIGDYTFMAHLPILLKRWLGPVSFALYTPGYDLNGTLDAIQYVRNCLPESALIKQYVSFHIYFRAADYLPAYVPLSERKALQWPFDCSAPPQYATVKRAELYRSVKNLTYPINVGRNLARNAANTHFILASDIELYPSVGLIDQFLDLVWRNSSAVLGGAKPRVFPMPVFELEAKATLPDNKQQLLSMLATHKAIPFHSKVCASCHLVPNQTQWLRCKQTDELSVFSVGKRYDKLRYWEPFYISDNREPFFDERVTWEGQKNKRVQGFAMCLLDYEYHVLHPAFLVHHPGIKTFTKKSPRFQYVQQMDKFISHTLVPEYKILFGQNNKCSV